MKNCWILIPMLFLTLLGHAQWNPNTSVNLEVATVPMMDMESLTTSTGRTWVAYYHNNGSNYDMRAQLLDVDGTKLLGPDGMLVDDQSSGTATFVFNICKDANDNLIVAYQDQRTGTMNSVVYKISQTGTHLWSSSGVVLGAGLAPYPTVLSNGETAVAWNESTSNTLQIQKISALGTTVWSTPVTVQVGTSNTTRGQLVAGTLGSFTMVFQKRGFGIATTLYAQRYENNGTAVWAAPVQLSTETTSGARYYSLASEGDVTYFGYYSSVGSRFNSWLQRINADGTLPYGINGTNFSTATGSFDPYQQGTAIALNPGSLYVWSVCSYSNTNQNQYGVYVQKFLKQTGARQLTDNALNVYPISGSFDTQAGEVSLVDDAPVFMSYDVNYKIYATRLDGNGAFVWTGNRIELSSTTASLSTPKGRYGFTALSNSQAVAVWAETRSGVEKAYAQNITPGGLFTLDVTTQGSVPATITTSGGTLPMVATIYPSSANQAVTWSIASGTGAATISSAGLVTASANGTVWARARSVQDNTVVDSLLITISNQVPIGPPGFSFNSPAAAVATCPAPAAMNITLNTLAENGFSGAITLTAVGQPAGTTVGFSSNPVNAGSSTTVSLNGANLLSPGSYIITIEGTATGVTTHTVNLTYTINAPAPIAITQQPNAQTICAGSSVTYSVTATGPSVTYQWQQSLDGCNGPWTNVSGAVSSTYTIATTLVSMDNSAFRCIISGSCTASVISGCGLLTVVAPTSVVTQPLAQTACEGGAVSFTTLGTGTGVLYQWQINTGSGFVNLTNGGIYSGVTTATLNLATTSLSLNGYQYRCLLSNSTCTTAVLTTSAALTVNAIPAIGTQPQSQTTCAGGTVQFLVTGTGAGVAYQWQVNTGSGFVNLTNGGNYAGVTGSTLIVSAATVAMNGYQYRCVVSGTCNPSVNSTAVSLTVHAPVVLISSPSNVEVCAGSAASFTVTATSVPAINYQWQLSTDGGTTWSAISNATSATLSLSSLTTSFNGNRYRCLVSNNTCTTPTASTAAILNVRAMPTIGLSASPYTSLLPGQYTGITAVSSASTGGVVSTIWTLGGQAMSPQPTGVIVVATVANLGVYQASIRETWPSGLFCAATSPSVTISANVSSKLFIFPSPNDGNFSVSYYYGGSSPTKRQLNIFDGKGALVYQREFSVVGPYTILPVDMRNKARGIYYVVVGDASGNKLVDGKVHIR